MKEGRREKRGEGRRERRKKDIKFLDAFQTLSTLMVKKAFLIIRNVDNSFPSYMRKFGLMSKQIIVPRI